MQSGTEQSDEGGWVWNPGRPSWHDDDRIWRFTDDGDGSYVELVPFFDDRGAVTVSEVRVSAPGGVTTAELRRVRLGELVALVAEDLDPYRDAGSAQAATKQLRQALRRRARERVLERLEPKLDLPRRTGGAYPDAFYAQVARVWRTCTAMGVSPARTLADANGVPESTVNAWFKGARNRGLLPYTRRRNQ